MARSILSGAVLFGAAISCLTACANDRGGPKQDAPPGTGAGGKAGPAFGSMLSNGIGASLDERDRERAYAAEMRALKAGEPGAPVGWRSPESGRYGTIVPGPPYQSKGLTCREFSHTIYIDGQPQTSRGTACRNADGSWTPVG